MHASERELISNCMKAVNTTAVCYGQIAWQICILGKNKNLTASCFSILQFCILQMLQGTLPAQYICIYFLTV